MHFLIVKLSSIGDVIHTLPAVAALRRAFPESRISWVVERSAGVILAGNSTVDEIIVIDTRRWRKALLKTNTWQAVSETTRKLRGEPIDVAFDFQGLIKSGMISALAGSRYRLGFSNDGLREEVSRFFLTHQVVIDRRVHVIEKNLQLVRSIGVTHSGNYEFPIVVSPEDETYIDKWLTDNSIEQFVILNPGGGWPTKLWSPAKFAQISDWLWQQYRLESLVTYGPGEEGMADAIVTQAKLGHARKIDTTLKQFVVLSRRALLFVGGDTGPLHIAAACHTPIVGIYGPTEPNRNGPFDPLDITVGLDVECRPNCYRRRCATIECMDISVAMVAQAIERRLLQTKLWQKKSSNVSLPVLASH